ncbi:ion transporter [Gloeocapsa sp. PCC 73106]|uniref:ion transporter n=1 Tax=Gloeocapsa sp. PCC 73106 TaxID=102232 RepID=UPI0002ABB650|nr:ion transporter [Gloeocapsa sp. PCC 73106]ELS00144.1 Kef-type K+ ransport system, predicted NAD-binding component [Gloeocapsa sp. PCC 73106]
MDDLETPLGLIINLGILFLVLLSMAMFIAESYSLNESAKIWFYRFDLIILSVFAVEYVVRFLLAEAKLKFLFSFFSLIDLLAILPLVLVGIDVRFIRVLRWFRLLRIFRFFDTKMALLGIRSEDGIILARILLSLFSIVFIYSGLIYQAEHQANPENFRNFADAFYFSVVTMTTVGFGDVTPLSQAGRLLTVLMIFSGIIVIPGQVSDLLKQILKTTNKIDKLCSNCSLSFHDQDANYCKICGSILKKNSYSAERRGKVD